MKVVLLIVKWMLYGILLSWGACALSYGQKVEGGLEQDSEGSANRPGILVNPMDFSESPKIVKPANGPSPSEIERSIERGVRFLMLTQNEDGSFGTHETNRISEIYAPIPGSHQAFRAATTALSVSAMVEAS